MAETGSIYRQGVARGRLRIGRGRGFHAVVHRRVPGNRRLQVCTEAGTVRRATAFSDGIEQGSDIMNLWKHFNEPEGELVRHNGIIKRESIDPTLRLILHSHY